MSEPDLLNQPAPAPPKRRRRWLGCLGLPLLLLLTACGGFYAFLVHRADVELREAEAEADRLEPDGWRLEDIEARRKVLADEDNAALVVQAVKAKLPNPWPAPRPRPAPPALPGDDGGDGPPPLIRPDPVFVTDDLSSLPPEVQIDAALLRDLRADLKEAEPALAEARKLPALRDGRFPLQYTKDFFSTKIFTQDAREAARLMHHEAILLAQEGRADEALEATRGIVVAARSVGDEPLTISVLIRMACDAIAVQTLERVLAQGEPSAAELKKMQELLQAEAAEPLLLNSARGERAGQHELMKALKTGEAKLSTVADGDAGIPDFAGPMLARGAHGRGLRLLTEYVEIAKLPPEQQSEPLKDLERKVRQAKVEYSVLTALLMPAMIKVADAFRRDQAQLRCAIVAVAAERYRRDHGGWPAAAGELVPKYLKAMPADPYDGKPLRYKRLPDGVIVYSVGPDLQDDGGARNRANPLAKGTDYGFRLWDVDWRRQPPAEVLGPPDDTAP